MNYKIGPFRRLTGLTEGTLRYYEKLGLLKPSRNGDNDYRYYDELDFLRLVQAKQFNNFDIPLAELPREGRSVSLESMREVFARQRLALESDIRELYDKLARIKLHEEFFNKVRPGTPEIEQVNIRGIYRLFLSDPAVARHPDTPEIAKRWLSYMPYAHATLRIPLARLESADDGPYEVQVGIGMLERYFAEHKEAFREPMQYSPPNACIQGMAVIEDLRSITRPDLDPFFRYASAKNLIFLDDMFGWILYISREGRASRYYVSFRIAVA